MDKTKIIKILIGIAVAIGAIIYFFLTNKSQDNYSI